MTTPIESDTLEGGEVLRAGDAGQALLASDEAGSRLHPTGFDPSRIAEMLAGVHGKLLEPIIKKAADEFYCTALGAADDYLRENLDHNLKSHIDMLERENARMRSELHAVDQIVGPPWLTPDTRVERLREMSRATSELCALKYERAFAHTGPAS